jgi:hypothetical protein
MRVLPFVLLAGVVPVLGAQEAELERPAEWRIRADRADADTTELYFVGMAPGWHVTTGPSVILWDPARVAAGTYRLESEIFFFSTTCTS